MPCSRPVRCRSEPAMHLLIPLLLAVFCSGCANLTERGYWGAAAGWPDGARLASSAAKAARNPNTWVPAAGALLFGVTNLDEKVSDRAVDKAPIFGTQADNTSDTLRDIAIASYLLTAMLAPSDSLESRARGLLVGGATLLIDGTLVDGLKHATDRERPDGSDRLSFPSGHTSLATTSVTMAVQNVRYLDMPNWARLTTNMGLYGTAAATGWARVEAGRHFPSDVLAGYAIGSFLGRFAYHAFLESGERRPPLSIHITPTSGGAMLSVNMPLHGSLR